MDSIISGGMGWLFFFLNVTSKNFFYSVSPVPGALSTQVFVSTSTTKTHHYSKTHQSISAWIISFNKLKFLERKKKAMKGYICFLLLCYPISTSIKQFISYLSIWFIAYLFAKTILPFFLHVILLTPVQHIIYIHTQRHSVCVSHIF